MRDVFRGWKRKLGVVTLLLAGLCTSVWLWTNQVSVQVATCYVDPNQFLTAKEGYLRWSSYDECTVRKPILIRFEQPREGPIADMMDYEGMWIKWRWHWKFGEFEFGEGQCLGTSSMAVWAAPFWFFNMLLIAASSYLLLSKQLR